MTLTSTAWAGHPQSREPVWAPVLRAATADQNLDVRDELSIGAVMLDAADVIQDVLPSQAAEVAARGAVVVSVSPGGLADAAGLQPGDTVVTAGGETITSVTDLARLMSTQPEGSRLSLELVRNGEMAHAILPVRTAAALGVAGGLGDEGPRLGITVETLTEARAREVGLDQETHGVFVQAVSVGSPAARAGLHAGDVITAIDRQSVRSAADAAAALRALPRQEKTLSLARAAGKRSVTVAYDR